MEGKILMNKKYLAISPLILASCTLFAAENSDYLEQARTTTRQFGMGLKGHLTSAIKAGGPLTAISVCNTKAPAVAAYMSKKSHWTVARTSLKVRNQDNQPDSWELKVLDHFEQEKAKGADIAKLEYSEEVEDNGKKSFRYMKAIGTASVCLNCHASDLRPEVASKLDKLYPNDQARGYKEGDIRGAFTLEKIL